MIYISISETSLEIVQTSKGILDKEEKVTACARKVLPGQIFDEKGALNSDLLHASIIDALKTAYPSPITQNQIEVVIPDNDLVIKRFETQSGKKTADDIVSQAKIFLPEDITAYENFYKDINGATTKNILYTALPLSTIKSFAILLKKLNLKMNFLSTGSFSIYALLKPSIAENEQIAYVHCDNNLNFVVLDSEGPIEIFNKKAVSKNLNSELKIIVKKLHGDNQHKSLKRMILGGEKSLEINAKELESQLELTVIKMGAFLEDLIEKQKTNIDTGGVPTVYFDKVIGLINLTKMTDVPNFAVDMKNISSREFAMPLKTAKINEDMPHEEIKEIVEEEIPVVKETTPSAQTLIPDNIVEYQKSNLPGIFRNRLVLIGLFLSISLMLFGGFMIIGQSQISIPFISSPTPTPTITPDPTLTPTPTLDPSLKRSDLKLSVQNGTDRSGFAKENSDKLIKLGYKNIEIGNADRDDYEATVIRIKDSARKYLTLVITDIKDDFDTPTVETLPEDAKTDAVIILGKK